MKVAIEEEKVQRDRPEGGVRKYCPGDLSVPSYHPRMSQPVSGLKGDEGVYTGEKSSQGCWNTYHMERPHMEKRTATGMRFQLYTKRWIQ